MKRGIVLAAMTLANSMILVDQTSVPLAVPELTQGLGGALGEGQWILTANILPLAALMVLGGRLGDLLGLRRVFIAGALIFVCSSALVGTAQDMTWAIAARALQGTGAALMMPTALAIVSSVYSGPERGRALGILAGASAFFAASGPVLGGLLTSIDWRLVFLINVPLALITIAMTLRWVPALAPDGEEQPKIDYAGTAAFGVAIALLVFGLTNGQSDGWGERLTIAALGVSVLSFAGFAAIEMRAEYPLIEFRLFRHLNFLAANISQVLAGMVELGLGFLLPGYLLLVVGVSPAVAGLALIPATLPIILAGPLAGRMFDKVGGRAPLVIGFLALAASGVALGFAAPEESYPYLVPGLLLQGIGLGIVLTVNDPTGLTAVSERDQGQGAGMINTTEQLGGALGIALLSAVMLDVYRSEFFDALARRGINVTEDEIEQGKEFILKANEQGRNATEAEGTTKAVLGDIIQYHALGYEVMFFASAGIALLGALVCFVLVRKTDRVEAGPIFSRRSRWLYTSAGRSAAITKRPPTESESES